MGQVRVVFDGPQTFDAITVAEMTVQADQLVLLQDGAPVLNVPVETVLSVEGANGGRVARLRTQHPNHGKPWTAEEDAELAERWRAGASMADLGAQFGRSRGAVRSALLRLGLVERADSARRGR